MRVRNPISSRWRAGFQSRAPSRHIDFDVNKHDSIAAFPRRKGLVQGVDAREHGELRTPPESNITDSINAVWLALPPEFQRANSSSTHHIFHSRAQRMASSLVETGSFAPYLDVSRFRLRYRKTDYQPQGRRNRGYCSAPEFSSLVQPTPSSEGKSRGTKPLPSHQKDLEEDQIASRGVYIALGSNIGDRFGAIESACKAINEDPDMQIVRVSHLYETEPMYVKEQGRFLNGVCEIATLLPPLTLLDRLQAIENDLGRVKLIDKGPRNIDLDILLYRDESVKTERLNIPHALMWERAFVLRPLQDVVSDGTPLHLRAGNALQRLPPAPMAPSFRVATPLPPLRPQEWFRSNMVMAILNTTPDSFSDGGDNQGADVETLRDTIAAHVAAGASIIDIGGQSSRPNAEDITAAEEIARVLPAIEAAKSFSGETRVAISVDTYRAEVADAAVRAGAHIINDISAGLMDPAMLPTIARLGCSYVMMHMRGTPATMQHEVNTTYVRGVTSGVRQELTERLEAALLAGVYPWRIILDPGFGFAKTVEQNLSLLKNFKSLRNDSVLGVYPWLVGTSRKGFIGKLTGVTAPKDRMVGTAVTVAAATFAGADIFRVHDVQQMTEAIKLSAAIRDSDRRR